MHFSSGWLWAWYEEDRQTRLGHIFILGTSSSERSSWELERWRGRLGVAYNLVVLFKLRIRFVYGKRGGVGGGGWVLGELVQGGGPLSALISSLLKLLPSSPPSSVLDPSRRSRSIM